MVTDREPDNYLHFPSSTHDLHFQLFHMLSLTNARLDDMENRLVIDPQSNTAPSSPPTQDDEAEARTVLHNILFPEHPIPLHDAKPRSTFNTAPAHPINAIPASLQADQNPPLIHVQPPTAQDSNIDGSRYQATSRESVNEEVPTTDHHDKDSTRSATPKAEVNQTLHMGDIAPASFDPLCPRLPFPHPWDIVTQRLFSWALVWMEDDFVRTLESTALGYQVDEFALTIYTMMTFKRRVRSMTAFLVKLIRSSSSEISATGCAPFPRCPATNS